MWLLAKYWTQNRKIEENKWEVRNIGFWAHMLIIFKLSHNFFHHKFKRALWASDSFVILKFTKVKPCLVSGWVTSNIYPFVKQKHWTENTINANKCELSKAQILLPCFMQKQILMQK